jgi:hypothetical protein
MAFDAFPIKILKKKNKKKKWIFFINCDKLIIVDVNYFKKNYYFKILINYGLK